jgi:hypothetical protein
MKKNILYTVSIVFLVVSIIGLTISCEPDSCKDIACGTNQVCYQGNCICQNGLEGDNCSVSSVERFIGAYDVNEYTYTGTTTSPFYTSEIMYGSRLDEVLLTNFANTGITLRANISTSTLTGKGTHITINDSNGALEVSGEGEYNENLNRIDIQCNIKQDFQNRTSQVTFIKL